MDNMPLAERVIGLFERAWNRGDLDSLETWFADEIIFHFGAATRPTDVEDLGRLVSAWRSAFPDLTMTVEDVVEQGGLVAARVSQSGTHRGRWKGIEPTGRWFEMTVMFFFRFEDGQLVEVWELANEQAMLHQLSLGA